MAIKLHCLADGLLLNATAKPKNKKRTVSEALLPEKNYNKKQRTENDSVVEVLHTLCRWGAINPQLKLVIIYYQKDPFSHGGNMKGKPEWQPTANIALAQAACSSLISDNEPSSLIVLDVDLSRDKHQNTSLAGFINRSCTFKSFGQLDAAMKTEVDVQQLAKSIGFQPTEDTSSIKPRRIPLSQLLEEAIEDAKPKKQRHFKTKDISINGAITTWFLRAGILGICSKRELSAPESIGFFNDITIDLKQVVGTLSLDDIVHKRLVSLLTRLLGITAPSITLRGFTSAPIDMKRITLVDTARKITTFLEQFLQEVKSISSHDADYESHFSDELHELKKNLPSNLLNQTNSTGERHQVHRSSDTNSILPNASGNQLQDEPHWPQTNTLDADYAEKVLYHDLQTSSQQHISTREFTPFAASRAFASEQMVASLPAPIQPPLEQTVTTGLASNGEDTEETTKHFANLFLDGKKAEQTQNSVEFQSDKMQVDETEPIVDIETKDFI